VRPGFGIDFPDGRATLFGGDAVFGDVAVAVNPNDER